MAYTAVYHGPPHADLYGFHPAHYPIYAGESEAAPTEEDDEEDEQRAWYYHEQQQHYLELQRQWQEHQMRQYQEQKIYHQPSDDYYDEETAIKSEAIEAAYEQFCDDFMRAGPSVLPASRGSSAMAPIHIQDDCDDQGNAHEQYQGYDEDSQSQNHSAALPRRPQPQTYHSLPTALSRSSLSASSSTLDQRSSRSERSTPVEGSSSLSMKLGINLRREHDQYISSNDDLQSADPSLQSQALHRKRNASASHEETDTELLEGGPGYDLDNEEDAPPLSESNAVAARLSTAIKKKPGRPRGSRELASINPTPLPLTPKKLRNGRVRDRRRNQSSSSESSSSEEEERERFRAREVYRPQYRLARPYRRRVPKSEGEKRKSDRSVKEPPVSARSPDQTTSIYQPSATLMPVPGWTKPWILSPSEGVPSYPEVHCYIRCLDDEYQRQTSKIARDALISRWGMTSEPASSQEEMSDRNTLPPNAEEARRFTKERDAQDDEDDAAVASLLFQEADVSTPLPKDQNVSSSPLWCGTIATRVSIADVHSETEDSSRIDLFPRATKQNYSLLVRQQFFDRMAGGSVTRRLRLKDEGTSAATTCHPSSSSSSLQVGEETLSLSDLVGSLPMLPLSGRAASGSARIDGGRRWSADFNTKLLWELVVKRYRLARAAGQSHEEALWVGPKPLGSSHSIELTDPTHAGGSAHVDAAQGGRLAQAQKRDRPPILLRRNLPRGIRRDENQAF